MSADLFAIEADPTLGAYQRLVLATVECVRICLAESGAPFTADQERVLSDVNTWAHAPTPTTSRASSPLNPQGAGAA